MAAHSAALLPTNINGQVFNPDGTSAGAGVQVTATNLNGGGSASGITNGCGYFSIALPASPGDPIRIEARKEDMFASTTIIYPAAGGISGVNLTLQPAAPALTPVGLLALVGALSAIAVLALRRRW
jgi:hypothetical protein